MKITICGSIAFLENMRQLKDGLEKLGHEVIIPFANTTDGTGKSISEEEYYKIRKNAEKSEKWVWERKKEEMIGYCDRINESDAILVANYSKNNIDGYVGANTLMEMGLALWLRKKIFLLNDVPEISYQEEILGMEPIIINNNLVLIK